VQDGWSLGAIEPNGDAGATGTYVDNDADLASQFWTTNCSELADLETNADCNPVCFQIHGLPRKREQIVLKKGHMGSNVPEGTSDCGRPPSTFAASVVS
jgi:hypothetical protein